MEKTNFRKVADEFHGAFGHPNNIPKQEMIIVDESKKIMKDEELKTLRLNLIKEEFNELKTAWLTYDYQEIADAIGDILYVVYGAGACLGINMDIKNEITDDKSNYFIYPFNYQIALRQYRENHFDQEPPKTPKLKLLQENNKERDELLKYLQNTLVNLEKNWNDNNIGKVASDLNQIVFLCNYLAVFLAINVDEVFDIIHKSNMSKLCSNEEEAKQTVKLYGEKEIKANYKKSDVIEGKWIVYNEDTGKILKSINYTKPDLSKYYIKN
jgi:predicted HAD superfamily Cof-like phosphohydrolase